MSFDTQAKNAKFHARFSFTYPLLCDTDRTMGLAYGAAKRPGTGGAAKRIGVIIDPEGNVSHYDRSAGVVRFAQAALDML